jgi:hypothetical protein
MCGGHHGHGGGSSCCCGHGGHGHHGCCCGAHYRHHDCGCGHPFGFRRQFSTREEEAAALEQYLKDLEAEANGVRERLAELKGA